MRCLAHTQCSTSISCFLSLGLARSPGTLCLWDGIPNTCPWCCPGLVNRVSANRAEISILPPVALLRFMPASSRLPTCFIWRGRLLLMLKLGASPGHHSLTTNLSTLQPIHRTLHLFCVSWVPTALTLTFPMSWPFVKLEFWPPSRPPATALP